jgi:hypothetical protein
MSWVQAEYRAERVPDLRNVTARGKGGDVDQNDSSRRERSDNDLDREMEKDTQIRRDTQVRGSLGIPPSGGSGESTSRDSNDRDEAVPEFERGSDEDRTSER